MVMYLYTKVSQINYIGLILLFIFGMWCGAQYMLWQMSKSNKTTIREYVEYNYPHAYERWYIK